MTKVAENFVFHSKYYFGVEARKGSIDTVSLVKALASKFGKESENPRTLAIADYGTGKSHLAVTLEDKKIHLDTFKATTILWVDTESVEAKFQQLFKKIDNNRNIEEAKRLNFELDELIKFYGLPETMDVHYRLARIRFKQFEDAERTWNYRIEDINTTLDESIERGDKISLRKMEVCYIKI